MPVTKINYQKTIMYKVVCKDLTIKDVYVGNTTDFIRRKSEHRRPSRTDSKLNTIINDNGGWENWEMLEIEKFPCLDGNEAKTRLRFWYEQLNANAYNSRSIITIGEVKRSYVKKIIQNKPQKTEEEIKKHKQDYKKEYDKKNAVKILEYSKALSKKRKEARDEKVRLRFESGEIDAFDAVYEKIRLRSEFFDV